MLLEVMSNSPPMPPENCEIYTLSIRFSSSHRLWYPSTSSKSSSQTPYLSHSSLLPLGRGAGCASVKVRLLDSVGIKSAFFSCPVAREMPDEKYGRSNTTCASLRMKTGPTNLSYSTCVVQSSYLQNTAEAVIDKQYNRTDNMFESKIRSFSLREITLDFQTTNKLAKDDVALTETSKVAPPTCVSILPS